MQRASNRQWSLKPQDLAIALKLVALKSNWLPYAELGDAMHLSRYEAHAAVQRLLAARLAAIIDGPPQIIVAALRQFVVCGAFYTYPAVRGGITMGFPTAHAAPPLKEMLVASNDLPPIWPHPNGNTRGQILLPLYESLPLAAQQDRQLYELLALFDALRAGQARERELAIKLLEAKLQ